MIKGPVWPSSKSICATWPANIVTELVIGRVVLSQVYHYYPTANVLMLGKSLTEWISPSSECRDHVQFEGLRRICEAVPGNVSGHLPWLEFGDGHIAPTLEEGQQMSVLPYDRALWGRFDPHSRLACWWVPLQSLYLLFLLMGYPPINSLGILFQRISCVARSSITPGNWARWKQQTYAKIDLLWFNYSIYSRFYNFLQVSWANPSFWLVSLVVLNDETRASNLQSATHVRNMFLIIISQRWHVFCCKFDLQCFASASPLANILFHPHMDFIHRAMRWNLTNPTRALQVGHRIKQAELGWERQCFFEWVM